MPGHGFVRFNLHNSLCSFPASLEVLKPLVDISEEALWEYLLEIDRIQNERVVRLQAACAKEIERLKGKRVLFLGDSITNDNLGYRVSVSRAAELESINGSISGGTSSMLVPLAKHLIGKRPEIVSLMIGVNDSISLEKESFHQVSLEEYARNVDAILGWAKQSGAKILLFEITPILEDRFEKCFANEKKLQSNAMIQRYNRILKQISEQHQVELLPHPWLSETTELDLLYESDGIHLSVKGQERFAENWLTVATSIL
ncbi:MAG: SGNH/GDSL hydrolase family protein [Clostridia bacterium]|nr:SGNH/GDSL hydrolase family protein [Clostridia bacterium]